MWFGHKSSDVVKELLEDEEFNLKELLDQDTIVKDLRSEGDLFAQK